MRCILFTIALWFGVNAAKTYEFLGFGEMHLVHYRALIWCQRSQAIGILMVWRDASCSLSLFDLVSMQPNLWILLVWRDASGSLSRSDSVSMQPTLRNSYGMARCILFIIALWFGVNAAKPSEFLCFGEMHPVHYRALIWCQCSQTLGIPMVWRDASCSLPRSDLVSMQPIHWNSYVLAALTPTQSAIMNRMHLAKP